MNVCHLASFFHFFLSDRSPKHVAMPTPRAASDDLQYPLVVVIPSLKHLMQSFNWQSSRSWAESDVLGQEIVEPALLWVEGNNIKVALA